MKPQTMQPGMKYRVSTSSDGRAIGHFRDDIYYEPYGSENRLGHLDEQGNLVYYSVKPGETPSIRGNYSAGRLVRDDGFIFLVVPDV